MAKFYLFLWLRWAIRVTICSFVLASIISSLITTLIYFNHGATSINSEVSAALFDIFKFWFPIAWSIALLIALFRSTKYIFNSCMNGYELKLLECQSKQTEKNEAKILENIGYGDLVKVWRKWFMVIIWLVGVQMIFALFFTYLFSSYQSVFEWFSIYWLFAFVLSGGYLSFILLGARCKRVKVQKC